MNNFIYDIRMKDLRHKYFGDILSQEIIDKEIKPVVTEEDEVVKGILKQYEKNRSRTKRNKKRK